MNKIIATGLTSGLIPGAPGTWGSIAAVLLWLTLCWLSIAAQGPDPFTITVTLAVIFSLIGGPVIKGYLKNSPGTDDPHRDPKEVVIDEWAGQLIALIGITPLNGEIPSFTLILIAFGLFRLFDITKIAFISTLERIPGAIGILLDDILAGIYAALIGALIVYFL